MNLSAELNKLSEKINFYSNVLNKKTEEINDIDIKNKEDKLEKWDICKKKLMLKLRFLDNKLNRFIKDSNNCISDLKSDLISDFKTDLILNKKLKFGNPDDSDDEEPEVEEEAESENMVGKVAEELFEVEFNEKVIKELDVNKRLYNCMLYGTLLLASTKISYTRRIQEGYSYRKEIKTSKLISFSFLFALRDNNAYLAGGYINMATNYPSLKNSRVTDLDIYINKKNFINFFTQIKSIFEIISYRYDISSPYTESFFKKNGLLSRFTLYLKNTIKLDILIIRDDYNLKDVIKNFDLTYCSVYLDPTDLTAKNFKIEGEVEAMKKKSGKLNDDYAKKYLFNNFIQNRIKKYSERGYETLIETNIDIVMKKKEEKIINESVVIHSMLKEMYNEYRTFINLPDLIFTISILNYNKENIIESAKTISTKLYNEDKYYYYILIKLIQKILDTKNPYVKNENKHPNYFKLVDLLEDFKNELIEEAKKNGELQFTKKPSNNKKIIELFKYPSSNYLNRIKTSLNINLKLNLIDELLKISNDNPNYDLSEILLKSSNDFLSNPKYTNIIITFLYNIRNHPANLVVDDDMFGDYWFLQKKPGIATMANFDNFRDEIMPYTHSDINFREIMYFDVYEYKEIIFDEVYKNKDNLLFVLKDTKRGFTYNFGTLTTETLLEFILECTVTDIGAPILSQIKNQNKWYSQISAPYNIGILVGQLYQAYSLYENSNKEVRKFILDSPEKLNYISNINAIQWDLDYPGKNIWGEWTDITSNVHCGHRATVYNKIFYEL